MAVGATAANVLSQFLVAAIVLSGIGGRLGIALLPLPGALAPQPARSLAPSHAPCLCPE